jgi:hypothetical protein
MVVNPSRLSVTYWCRAAQPIGSLRLAADHDRTVGCILYRGTG